VCSVGTVKEDLCTHQALSNVYIEIIIVVVISVRPHCYLVSLYE